MARHHPQRPSSAAREPVRARPVSRENLRIKVLSEDINELRREINRLFQEHQAAVDRCLTHWAKGNRPASPKRRGEPHTEFGMGLGPTSPQNMDAHVPTGMPNALLEFPSEKSADTAFEQPVMQLPGQLHEADFNGDSLEENVELKTALTTNGTTNRLSPKPMAQIEDISAAAQLSEDEGDKPSPDISAEPPGMRNRAARVSRAVRETVVPELEHRPKPGLFKSMTQALDFSQTVEEYKFNKRGVFTDLDELKLKMKSNLAGEIERQSLFREAGWCVKIATNTWFERLTVAVILTNAIWMGYDADMNQELSLATADLEFVIAENLFFVFFAFEWAVRLGSYQRPVFALRDTWYLFDSTLVFLMLMETWIIPTVASNPVTLKAMSSFRWIRLVRLTRLARIVKLLRALPELLIMIKAIMISAKSVFYAFILLIVVIYIFSVAFTILMEGHEQEPGDVRYDSFRSVTVSMNTLFLNGILPDQGEIMLGVGKLNPFFYAMMLLYFIVTSFTLMNMLIGILCEVITVTSALEKEEMLLQQTNFELSKMMSELGLDRGDMTISRFEFQEILALPRAARVLQEVGVDAVGLVDTMDFIFKDDEESRLSFGDFMDVILQLRGTNTATVKDIIDLRSVLLAELDKKVAPRTVQITSTEITCSPSPKFVGAA